MLKAAVVGVGSMGQNHARVYRTIPGVTLVGVVDENPDVAEQQGRQHVVPHYTSFNALLDAERPDLVSIAVPTSAHFVTARAALIRGVHTLVEKPIATSVAEARALIELAEAHGAILAVGHIERFNPAITELRKRLRDGMLGRVYKIFAQRLSPYPGRIRDTGVVVDLASHDIDLLRFLTSERVVRVYGETLQSINSDREDLFHGLVRFESGALGVLDVNWMTPTKVRRLTVTGARGFIECNLLSQELFFYENNSAPSHWDTLSMLRGVTEGNVLGIRIERREPLVAELEDFVGAIRDCRDPVVTGSDGLETLKLVLEFMQSTAEREPISLR